jgi:hypothetical protein
VTSRAARALLAALCTLPALGGAHEPPPEALLAELPFLEAGPNQVRVDPGSPGRALPLLLDTGALQSFATAGGARALGVSVRRGKQTPYRRSTRLGRDVELWVDTRRGDTGEASGGDYALVGAPFLSAFVLELDFPARQVRFFDPQRYRVPESSEEPGSAVLPLRSGSQRPVVEIEVGGARVPALLATGAPGTLILPAGWAEPGAVEVDEAATAGLALPRGAGAMQAAVADRVALGPFEERRVPLLLAPRGAWQEGPRSDAVLGVDFLKRFVLRIDAPRGRVWIREGRPAASGP